MRKVTVGSIQMAMSWNKEETLSKAEKLVREAAKKGAQIILLPELFETPYFCQEKNYDYYQLATTLEDNPAILRFKPIAKELDIVLPISFYEIDGNSLFNTVALIDTNGEVMGIYRKTHIPDDHFYQEKFYFTPGDTGFKVWQTKYGNIGVGICWDQWFPESARCMALLGAELLFYPTAIGSEPVLECDSMPHWRRCMQGHAASNIMPLIASNRIGEEKVFPSKENNYQESSLNFYGSSFIADETGEIVKSGQRDQEEILIHTFDLDAIKEMRLSWGVFRDRRPEAYSPIMKNK
ncbi:MAG: N-carbamoylputrescine amidase [Beduini sp.]|uniref:N-carbamoylputrescine amidase n=1 Tax=Beduini sp. TaxID=1922300 RepID=UPI0039A2D988